MEIRRDSKHDRWGQRSPIAYSYLGFSDLCMCRFQHQPLCTLTEAHVIKQRALLAHSGSALTPPPPLYLPFLDFIQSQVVNPH